MNGQRFVVFFRVGGRERFAWHETVPMSKEMAAEAQREIETMGYACFVAAEGSPRPLAYEPGELRKGPGDA